MVINDRGPFTRGVTQISLVAPLLRLACTEHSGCASSEREWPSRTVTTMAAPEGTTDVAVPAGTLPIMAAPTPVFGLIAGDVLVQFFDPSSSGELGGL